MITFEKFFYLEEARRNPEQNPKISVYEFLKPYSDDPDVYISFTEDLKNWNTSASGEKLGINPQSKFNTPLGIYFYPLQEAWEMYDVDRTKSLKQFPFAANNPHVWLVRAKGVGTSFVDDMYSDYGSNDYDRDIITLKTIWEKEVDKIDNFFISYDFDEDYENALAKVHLHQDNLKKLQNKEPSVLLPDNNTHKWVTDKLNAANLELARLEKYKKAYIKNNGWNDLVSKSLEYAKVKNAVMSFWNVTRNMAMVLSKRTDGIKMATKWNWLLRQCGYTGFADKSAKGYIHPSEPMQVVFLTRQAFDVIGVWDNKDYNTNKNAIKSIKDMISYTKDNPDTTIEFLYYLADKHLDTEYTTGVVKNITKSPKELIDECDYETIKDFFLLLTSYAKKYKVHHKDEYLTCCKVIRSKYSIANMMYKDTPEWNRINAIINLIDDIFFRTN